MPLSTSALPTARDKSVQRFANISPVLEVQPNRADVRKIPGVALDSQGLIDEAI
jgi:hypothetical protein